MVLKNGGEEVNYKEFRKQNQQNMVTEGKGEEGVQENSEGSQGRDDKPLKLRRSEGQSLQGG